MMFDVNNDVLEMMFSRRSRNNVFAVLSERLNSEMIP
jgi:hypothetical protein